MASTIRPDTRPPVAANFLPLWLLFGGLGLIALTLYLYTRLFPPDVGLDMPTVGYEGNRFVVTSRVVNHTIHPLVLHLRFKIYPASTEGRGPAVVRPFERKDVDITLPGTTETIAKCEFPRTASAPGLVAAELQLLSK